MSEFSSKLMILMETYHLFLSQCYAFFTIKGSTIHFVENGHDKYRCHKTYFIYSAIEEVFHSPKVPKTWKSIT